MPITVWDLVSYTNFDQTIFYFPPSLLWNPTAYPQNQSNSNDLANLDLGCVGSIAGVVDWGNILPCY